MYIILDKVLVYQIKLHIKMIKYIQDNILPQIQSLSDSRKGITS